MREMITSFTLIGYRNTCSRDGVNESKIFFFAEFIDTNQCKAKDMACLQHDGVENNDLLSAEWKDIGNMICTHISTKMNAIAKFIQPYDDDFNKKMGEFPLCHHAPPDSVIKIPMTDDD